VTSKTFNIGMSLKSRLGIVKGNSNGTVQYVMYGCPDSSCLTLKKVVTLRDHSRSLEMTPFDRSHIVLHCDCLYLIPFLKYSTSNSGMPLKSGLEVIQGH